MTVIEQQQSVAFVRQFDQIDIDDIPSVGGKNASLGEMYRELRPLGVNIPDGFAVTAAAYRHFLREAGLEHQITRILDGLDTADIEELQRRGSQVRQLMVAARLPTDLEQAITAAYDELSGDSLLDVAVRSSATAEDLPDASFAGQQETYLNVQGLGAVLH